jgi:uracil DNA glycosylase
LTNPRAATSADDAANTLKIEECAVVFVLRGASAQKMKIELIDTAWHTIIKSAHSSPPSA